MKKLLLFVPTLLLLVNTITAQKAQPVKNMYLPLSIVNDNGTTGTYLIKKGDQLVYHVNAGGTEYDFIVTVNGGGPKKAIDFNYRMTNANATAGHVTISAAARSKARKYLNYFGGGELALSDASTVWLTDINFTELASKKTTMTFDNGEPQTMYTTDASEAGPVVMIKGVAKKLNTFTITNAAFGSQGDKTLVINNAALNPLIIKMDLGFTIELKEIR